MVGAKRQNITFIRVNADVRAIIDGDDVTPQAPQPVNPNTPMTIIVTADMGETYEDGSQYHWEEPSAVNTTVGMARLAAAQDGGHVDVILHPGDLAYATGYVRARVTSAPTIYVAHTFDNPCQARAPPSHI